MKIIKTETSFGRALDGTINNNPSPIPEPIKVRVIRPGKRLRLIVFCLRKGKVAPILIKVRAIILVAKAVCGSMPICNIIGMVIKDVLPIITLIMLVTKKTAMRIIN